MLDLIAADVAAFSDQHGSDILALALRAVKLGNQIDRKHALIAAELSGHTVEIDILVISAVEAIGVEAGVYHRPNRRMPGRVEFLSQS
jgi:hypothetical protein